jgi:hypothetical protein
MKCLQYLLDTNTIKVITLLLIFLFYFILFYYWGLASIFDI